MRQFKIKNGGETRNFLGLEIGKEYQKYTNKDIQKVHEDSRACSTQIDPKVKVNIDGEICRDNIN